MSPPNVESVHGQKEGTKMTSKRSIHGGEDSHLEIEVSAVKRGEGRSLTTCNNAPEDADLFAVYIRNPLAFHIQDFRAAPWPCRGRPASHEASLAKAKKRAFTYADALAEHLGCVVHSHLKRDA
jgi:hypothetical protein